MHFFQNMLTCFFDQEGIILIHLLLQEAFSLGKTDAACMT